MSDNQSYQYISQFIFYNISDITYCGVYNKVKLITSCYSCTNLSLMHTILPVQLLIGGSIRVEWGQRLLYYIFWSGDEWAVTAHLSLGPKKCIGVVYFVCVWSGGCLGRVWFLVRVF